MKVEVIKPRIVDRGKCVFAGIVRLDNWLSFSFSLYDGPRGYWTKLGDSYKDKTDKWRDTVFCKKDTHEYKMVHQEVVDSFKTECAILEGTRPDKKIEDIVVDTSQTFTAEDIPF